MYQVQDYHTASSPPRAMQVMVIVLESYDD